MSDVPDDMIPDHGAEDGFSLVVSDEEVPSCLDCGRRMTVKSLQVDGLESDTDAGAYRCPECDEGAIEFEEPVPIEDFLRNFSPEELDEVAEEIDPSDEVDE